MSSLGRFHRALGFVVLALFLASGAYMRLVAHPYELADGPHLVYVSRHLYLLASALVHLALAAYVAPLDTRRLRAAQWIGSALLSASSGLLALAFVIEAMGTRPRTDASSFGLYAVLAGTLVHFAAAQWQRMRSAGLRVQR